MRRDKDRERKKGHEWRTKVALRALKREIWQFRSIVSRRDAIPPPPPSFNANSRRSININLALLSLGRPPKEVDLGANMSGNWAFFKSVKDVCIDWMEPIKKEPFKISERHRRTDSYLTNAF